MEANIIVTDQVLLNAHNSAFSYLEFYNLTAAMVADNNTTGPVKNEARIQATKLNLQRLNRLNKTIQLLPQWDDLPLSQTSNLAWLVITETWCGDGAQIVPVINKIAEKLHIKLSIVMRDEHLELIDRYLYKATRSIPILVCFNKATNQELGNWGPRPAEAIKLVDEAKLNGIPHDDFVTDLQLWYNLNKTVSLQNELFLFVNDCLK